MGPGELRILIAGLVLLGLCSGLLGVVLGWWLRGEEVRRLKNKVSYLQEQLREAWSKKATRMGVGTARERVGKGEIRKIDIDLLGARGELCGEPWPEHPEYTCIKPRGHDEDDGSTTPGTKHGYAGMFW